MELWKTCRPKDTHVLKMHVSAMTEQRMRIVLARATAHMAQAKYHNQFGSDWQVVGHWTDKCQVDNGCPQQEGKIPKEGWGGGQRKQANTHGTRKALGSGVGNGLGPRLQRGMFAGSSSPQVLSANYFARRQIAPKHNN